MKNDLAPKDLATLWSEQTFVSFDTETTGKYPLTAEVCELSAVKWRCGEIIETFSTLLKPSKPMGEAVIKIHGITNAMVEDAPVMRDKVAEFRKFIAGSIAIAHHAPFDLGFMAYEFELAGLPLPQEPVICTSLLSRRVFPESGNHRLQTLVEFFNLEKGQAHRALDDAKACLQVALKCMDRVGTELLADIFTQQGGELQWQRFSINDISKSETQKALIKAVKENRALKMVYSGGSTPGQPRLVYPEGIVRNPEGDFLVARDNPTAQTKRYFLEKITAVE